MFSIKSLQIFVVLLLTFVISSSRAANFDEEEYQEPDYQGSFSYSGTINIDISLIFDNYQTQVLMMLLSRRE